MKVKITFFVLLIIGFQSCKSDKKGMPSGITKTAINESIPENIKEEINKLDAILIKALVDNDVESMKAIMSDELLETSKGQLKEQVGQMGGVLKLTDYEIVDQYYVQNTSTGLGNSVMPGLAGPGHYTLKYLALNKEMFVSLMVPENGQDEFLLTNIYGKHPDGWKLNIIQLGQYTLAGKTAPQHYEQALEEYEQGFLIDASNSMLLNSLLTNPVNGQWKYRKEKKMKEFYEKILSEVKEKYEFPMTLSEIPSKPEIIRIYPLGIDEGYFPVVEYLTSLDIEDRDATGMENNQIHKIIEDKFTGLTKGKKYTLYDVYNEIPDGKTEVATDGFKQENK